MSLYDRQDKQILEQQGLIPFLRLYKLSELGDVSRTLAVYIHHAEKSDGTCWASDKTISELAGVSVRTLQTHTLSLLTKQYLASLGTQAHGIPEYEVHERFRKKSKEPFFALPIQALNQIPQIVAASVPNGPENSAERQSKLGNVYAFKSLLQHCQTRRAVDRAAE